MLEGNRSIRASSVLALITFLTPLVAAEAKPKEPRKPEKTGLDALIPAVDEPPPARAEPAPVAEPPPPPPPAAPGGLKIEGTNVTLKLGFLLQPGYEFRSSNVDRTVAAPAGTTVPPYDGASHAFFLRRARLLIGMTLGQQFELFAETETANMGRITGLGPNVASTVGANIQDAFLTWKPMDEFKVDTGMMLIPLSHNSLQGATSLYSWDYFANSFNQIGPIGNYVGRDTGVQFRGLVLKQIEYRLGVFTGKRLAVAGPMAMPAAQPSRAALRFAGRLQYNVFDAETAYFYAGTYGGAKKILSFGAGFDHQDDYNSFALDAFMDWPLGSDVITAQAVLHHYNGKTWLPALPTQTNIMFEAGYRLGSLKLSPIVRFEMQNINTNTTASDALHLSAGAAWWFMGHNANIKAFLSVIKYDAPLSKTIVQLNLQQQFFVF